MGSEGAAGRMRRPRPGRGSPPGRHRQRGLERRTASWPSAETRPRGAPTPGFPRRRGRDRWAPEDPPLGVGGEVGGRLARSSHVRGGLPRRSGRRRHGAVDGPVGALARRGAAPRAFAQGGAPRAPATGGAGTRAFAQRAAGPQALARGGAGICAALAGAGGSGVPARGPANSARAIIGGLDPAGAADRRGMDDARASMRTTRRGAAPIRPRPSAVRPAGGSAPGGCGRP